jgi:hypothetical protein
MGKRTIKSAESAAGMHNSTVEFETEAILMDPIIIEMLESADRQYKEGKTMPLSKLMMS